jgi:aminoglycoside 3-N-acetyltransferase
MQGLSAERIVSGLSHLGLRGRPLAVHSSLRSFGCVEGGAETVVSALQSVCRAVLMPGFQCAANTVLPPPEQRPQQNGCDYAIHFNLSQSPEPFDVDKAPIHPKMGRISHTFARGTGVYHSDHPWHSWLAWGENAPHYVRDHLWDTTNLPLERLAAAGGWVALLGVTLVSCTAIHIAEERAGRRPFIRWALDRQGRVRVVRVCGCAKGFDRLYPYCQTLFRETQIGPARIMAAPIAELIELLTPVFREYPSIARCSDTCLRCRDAALGGPIEKPV